MESRPPPPNECPRCGNILIDDSSENPACPSCALRAVRPSSFWESPAGNWPQKYIQTLRRILTAPSKFFHDMPVTGGLGGPLAFALITHWLSKVATYLWSLVFGQALFPAALKYLDRVEELAAGDESVAMQIFSAARDRLAAFRAPDHWVHSFFGMASVVLDPFLTVISLLFSTTLIYIGARCFISPGNGPGRVDFAPTVTFESVLRILCYATAPVILTVVPLVGGLLASLGTFLILVIGIREVYRSTNGRAMLVAVFPQLLLMGFLFLGFAVILVFFFTFFSHLMR